MKVFLDMDGVIANFVLGITRAHNRELPYEDEKDLGVFELEDVWKMSTKEVWTPKGKQLGHDFWANLEKHEEADDIVNALCQEFGEKNICILTNPSSDPECIGGKTEWIKKHYPSFSKRMLFGGAKEFLAGPERLLVDDRDKNIEAFSAAGGHTITVPRPWNSKHPRSKHVMQELLAGIYEVTNQ